MNWVKQLFTTKTNLHRSLIGTMLGDCSGSPYEGSFDSVLLNALQYGGDVDTIAAMACGLATIKYGIPQSYLRKVIAAHLDNSRMYKMILAL